MSDPWDFWRRALANPRGIGQLEAGLLLYNEHPEWGYWKTRRENGPWEPVQIWQSYDGQWFAQRGGANVPSKDVGTLWTWCNRFPITEEAYERALSGGGWEDDDPTVAEAMERGAGDNSAGLDEAEALRDQIDAALAGMDAYAKIIDDKQAAKAQSLRSRLNELSGEADKRREQLVRPHLDAQKKVNAKWQPLVKDAKLGADALRGWIERYSTEQLRIRREAERKLEEDRRKAEQEARQKAEAAGRPDLTQTFVEAAVPPLPAPETKIKGTYGRAASKKVEKYVVEVTDRDALYRYFRDTEEVRATLRNLASTAVKRGHDVPGVKIEERVVVS